jgi:hypothetical protein
MGNPNKSEVCSFSGDKKMLPYHGARDMRTKRICIIPSILGLVAITIGLLLSQYTHAADAIIVEPSKPSVFTFHLKKGQYLLSAFGRTGARTIRPLGGDHFREDCDVTITIQPGARESGQIINQVAWRVEEKTRQTGSGTWGAIKLQDKVEDKADVTDIEATLQDISKEASLGGIQIYRIPYGKADGEIHSFILAIADTPEPFPMIFTIPKTAVFAKFEWKSLWTDCPSR